MDVRAILQQIDADAHAASDKAIADAKEQAQKLKEESLARINKQKADAETRAKTDMAETEQRMLRMAELEERKALLAAKRELLDQAFSLVVKQFNELTVSQKQAFLLRCLLENAMGDETLLLGDTAHDWYDAAFLVKANAALKAAGKAGALKAGTNRVEGSGFVLQRGGAETNCTFEVMIGSMRFQLEADTARALFD